MKRISCLVFSRIFSHNRKHHGVGSFSMVLVLLILAAVSFYFIPLIFASAQGGGTDSQVHKPFPIHTDYAPGMLKANHVSQQKQDDLVSGAYDDWKKRYLIPVADASGEVNQMYRVAAGKKKQSRTYSEGQGYGMILAVYMAGYDPNAQTIFDGLWLFARNHASPVEKRFMVYQIPINKDRQDSAFDGDCDMALALLLADSQWGSGGRVNYRQEALFLMNALLEKVIGRESRLPMLGDWVKPNGQRYNQYTLRSSDIMPSHFRVFFRVTGNIQWQEVSQRCQALVERMQTTYSPRAGLLPDFIVGSSGEESNYKPADSWFLESAYDGHYFYNAARVPWRLGFDALLNNDPISQSQVRRIAHWIVEKTGGRPSRISPGYTLKGKQLSNESYVSKAFIAPFGVAAMVLAGSQDFVNGVFDMCVELQQDYFEDTIGLLCLLIITGNSWLPD